MSQDARYFQQTYPRDMAAYDRAHLANWVAPLLLDPSARLAQSAIIDTDLYSGVEAWDYQNPYVWTSRQLLTVATLDPAYGIPADTGASVARNIAVNQNLLGV